MIYQIGDIKTEWNTLVYPTQQRFDLWKEEFLELPNVDKYDVWLCGKFLQKEKTTDVDIILTNEPDLSELREILIQGIQLGIKYNILVDIQHASEEPIHHNKVVKKIVYGKQITKGKEVLSDLTNKVYEDLYSYEKTYKKKYKVKPIKIN